MKTRCCPISREDFALRIMIQALDEVLVVIPRGSQIPPKSPMADSIVIIVDAASVSKVLVQRSFCSLARMCPMSGGLS